MFQGTIRENLVCGKDISREQMEEACGKAGIHEEILRMPGGYETMLTENGGQPFRRAEAAAVPGQGPAAEGGRLHF